MQNLKPLVEASSCRLSWTRSGCGLLLVCCLVGCGSTRTSPSSTALQAPQMYFAPYVSGTTSAGSSTTLPQTYTIDDLGDGKTPPLFSQATYQLQSPAQQGPQVINAGTVTIAARGLRNLNITATYTQGGGSGPYLPVTDPPEPGLSFAVELAGQAGGLVQLAGQPAAPLVAATQCPNFSSPQTYQFLTIPASLAQPSDTGTQFTWDPTVETAYGSVDVSSNGSTVTFANIHQLTLPSVGGTHAPAQPPASSLMGTCDSTFYGSTITVPGQLVVTAPGNSQSVAPQASIGIGPSGLLVEDNGASTATYTLPGTTPGLHYNNVLGAGTGAVGLPKPSGAIDTGALTSAQYLGFVYSAGTYVAPTVALGFSSHLASFGFSSVPSSCASVAPNTGTLIYGGDFPADTPSSAAGGFGNCDLAIDFGAQDASQPGLFPSATVSIGASYAANTAGVAYSFPAVAIAAQLNGKFAIFLLGVDSVQPWAVYLLQSN